MVRLLQRGGQLRIPMSGLVRSTCSPSTVYTSITSYYIISFFQVEVLREGLLSVVPQSVLQLFTVEELELRVCGSPKISIEELKKSSRLSCTAQHKNVSIQ